MPRSLKKIIYGLFYFALLGVAVGLFFLGRGGGGEDMQEDGVKIQPPTVQRVERFRALDNKTLVVFWLFSAEPKYVAERVSYEIAAYDEKARLITRKGGRTLLYPERERIIILTLPEASYYEVQRIEAVIKEVRWSRFVRAEIPQVEVMGEPQIELIGDMLRIRGEIRNLSSFEIAERQVAALLYDEHGFLYFAAETYIYAVPDLGVSGFEIETPLDAELKQKAERGRVEVEIY